jgi:putative ABC transport system permease protein
MGTDSKPYTFLGIDAAFIPLMDIKIKSGRNFRPDIPSDSGKVIINEEAVRYFGLREPVTGQIFGTGERKYEIVGVVRDFHFNSLRSPIGPIIMRLQSEWLSNASIKVNSGNLKETLGFLQKTWNSLCPEFLFEYRFLDKSFEQLYKDELRLGRLSLYLAILAIFIATIGLMGLSSFLAEQRIKEIGIRKVTGDSTSGIIRLFTAEFARWVILSGIIAVPVTLYLMNAWLKGYAYRVTVDIFILTGSCLIALVIAVCTVVAQTGKIAMRNPVEALRYE